MKMIYQKIITKLKILIFKMKPVLKRRQNVILSKPAYCNRHKGRDFLVLGTAPTLNEYGDRIKAFARKKNLITIGANYIMPFMKTDYLGFVNRHRFSQYGHTIDPKRSRALLSIYFTDEMVKENCKAPFDFIMWRDLRDPTKYDIDRDGIITYYGSTGTLMIMVAYVMGARQIYVAGIEGNRKFLSSSNKRDLHYIHMPYRKGISDEKLVAKYRYWPNIQGQALDAIYRWAIDNRRKPFIFITPGLYNKYYSPKILEGI